MTDPGDGPAPWRRPCAGCWDGTPDDGQDTCPSCAAAGITAPPLPFPTTP